MRILIVEDEPKTAAYAKKGLTEHGFVVDVAANGVDGQHLALSSDYDLVVLDIMLPASTVGRCCARSATRSRRRFCFSRHATTSPTESGALSSAQTTIWSSPSRSPSCSRESARCCGADRSKPAPI